MIGKYFGHVALPETHLLQILCGEISFICACILGEREIIEGAVMCKASHTAVKNP
jgi:hypothetical protein